MSVLRRVKLRTPDGIESIEYPLGVEAENVEVANGENLSQRLARIDEDLENNEEDIATIGELAGTNKQNIGANEIRIDALERRSASVDKKPYYFNTVADMKAYQKLKAEDMAITLGYYTANDGGGAEYKIRNITNDDVVDNILIIPLNNINLIAELIIDDKLNLKQCGCYGDGINDDTTKIQSAINIAKNKNIKLNANKNDIFLISNTLDISNTFIDLNFAKIITNNNIDILTLNSTNYYTNINNVNIDCNNIANSGIHIINGRKATFENINILNVQNYAWYYEQGYEIFTNHINIYGNPNASNNIGIYNKSGDSYFNNIIIIDCEVAIQNIECFNYYTNVHAWIYNHINILNSKYLKISGSKCVLNNCYSDTYRYCIYQVDYIPTLLLSNFVNVYNHGILTPEILGNEHPYFMYCETSLGNSLTRLTNSNIEGYSTSILTYLTNLDNFSGQIINCVMKDLDKTVSFSNFLSSNRTTGVSEVVSNLNKNGNSVYFDGRFSMDATDTKSFVLGTIPYYFRTNYEIITMCSYGSGNYNVTGVCYLYINTNGQISVTLPTEATGTVYVKINQSWITTQDV